MEYLHHHRMGDKDIFHPLLHCRCILRLQDVLLDLALH